MIDRTQISEVMQRVPSAFFPTASGRNNARRQAVKAFLDSEKTNSSWVQGSETDMILSDLSSYPEWEK